MGYEDNVDDGMLLYIAAVTVKTRKQMLGKAGTRILGVNVR